MERIQFAILKTYLCDPSVSECELTSLLAFAKRYSSEQVPAAHIMKFVVLGYVAKRAALYELTPIGNYVALRLMRHLEISEVS